MPVARKTIPILLLIISIGYHAGAFAADNSPPKKQKQVFEAMVERSFKMSYLLYLPEQYGESPKSWPLLLYLHGGRGRGSDLTKLGWYPVPRILDEGKHEIPFVVIVPQCPEGELWTDTEALVSLLDDVMERYSVDPDRVYLVGYSMGGNGAWYLAYKHPDRFAAVSPMSGPANTWWATRLRDVPIWVFHGEKDEVVPARESQDMVEALRAKGGQVRFSLHPERGHSPPSDAEHLELFAWLLEHRQHKVGE
jgi:predicted peptidase